MENVHTTATDILKKEEVGYLKSALNLMPGTLILTPGRIYLDAQVARASGFGLLGALLRSRKVKIHRIFDLELTGIKAVSQGKHGIQKNVLEIMDTQNKTYRIIVKNYAEWENLLRK